MKNPTSARDLAGALVNAVLIEARSLTLIPPPGADPRTLAAARNLTYNTLRQAGALRFFLRTLSPRALNPPELLGPLLVALYELRAGEAPAYAVVHDAVERIGRDAPRARGFANGVLRAYLRERETLARAALEDAEARWNFPPWWQARLRAAYPDAWTAWLDTLNSHPPMTLRVNRRRAGVAETAARLAGAGIACRQTGPDALLLDTPIPIAELPGFAEGEVSVQDLGAQYAAPLLDCADGQRVLDACAAPGGKTAHLLERHDLDLLALDQDAARLAQVGASLRRLGLSAETRVADAGATADWWDGRAFDRILLDAPCTASGVVRRHPDGKWLKRPEDMQQLQAQQARLLDALWPLLKPAGTMLYATCSLFPDENQHQIAAFLARQPDAELHEGPAAASNDAPPCRTEPTTQQEDVLTGLLPPTPQRDGFFYARLHKRPR